MKKARIAKTSDLGDRGHPTINGADICPPSVLECIGEDAQRAYNNNPGFERSLAILHRRIMQLLSSEPKYAKLAIPFGSNGVHNLSFIATFQAFTALQHLERFEQTGSHEGDKATCLKPYYLKSLDAPEAAYHFLQVQCYMNDKRATRGLSEEDILNISTPMFLEAISYDLICGNSLSQSIKKNQEWISKRAELGDSGFFIRYGELIAKAKSKCLSIPFERWLLRAWLPLALWSLPPQQAVSALRDHAKLVRSAGGRPPKLGRDQDIKKNIRRFKMRLRVVERK
jgi:hypothetical protein